MAEIPWSMAQAYAILSKEPRRRRDQSRAEATAMLDKQGTRPAAVDMFNRLLGYADKQYQSDIGSIIQNPEVQLPNFGSPNQDTITHVPPGRDVAQPMPKPLPTPEEIAGANFAAATQGMDPETLRAIYARMQETQALGERRKARGHRMGESFGGM